MILLWCVVLSVRVVPSPWIVESLSVVVVSGHIVRLSWVTIISLSVISLSVHRNIVWVRVKSLWTLVDLSSLVRVLYLWVARLLCCISVIFPLLVSKGPIFVGIILSGDSLLGSVIAVWLVRVSCLCY